MDGAPVLRYFIPFLKDFIVKEMVPFISGALLKEERCCKFMLTYDIKNCF